MIRGLKITFLAVLVAGLFGLLALPWLLPRPGLDGSIPMQPYSDSAFVEIESTRVHYRARLDGHSETDLVVLIHGFGGSSFSWRHSLDFLQAQGYRVIAIDLPPFGYSARRSDGPDWAELVLGLADVIDPDAELVLVGHSMGARVAARAASLADERITLLVMVAGTPDTARPARGGTGWLLRIPSLLRWAEILAAHRLIAEPEFETILGSALGRAPTAEELSGYREPLTIPGTYPALLRRLELEAALSTDGWEQVPTSLIWGDEDTWVPLDRARALIDRHPDVPLNVVDETGHNPMDTHPEAFHQHLIGILRQSD